MLFGTGSLENQLVIALGKVGSLTASELHYDVNNVSASSATYTLQAVYKALSKLVDNGVIVKRNQEYTLSVTWCLDFISFGDILADIHLSPDYLRDELPRKGRAGDWSFKSLRRLNHFWCHLLLVIVQREQASTIFSYNHHPWMYLIRNIEESNYIAALKQLNIKTYKLVSSDDYLDHWCERFWDGKNYQYGFCGDYYPEIFNTYLNIVDDYILRVHLNDKTKQTLDELYENIDTEEKFKKINLSALLDTQNPCKITLSQDANEAELIKEKFSEFFSNKK